MTRPTKLICKACGGALGRPRNSFVGRIRAHTVPLLRGVMAIQTERFSHREDADKATEGWLTMERFGERKVTGEVMLVNLPAKVIRCIRTHKRQECGWLNYVTVAPHGT